MESGLEDRNNEFTKKLKAIVTNVSQWSPA